METQRTKEEDMTSKRYINYIHKIDEYPTASKLPFRKQVTSNKEIVKFKHMQSLKESEVLNNNYDQMHYG